MKKVLSILVVLILACAAVFAGNYSVRGHLSPLPFFITVPMIGDDFVNMNADVEFNYYPTENFRVGIEADVNYSFANDEESFAAEIADNLISKISAFAKLGYSIPVSNKFAIALDAGFGGCIFADAPTMAATLQLTGAYKFNSDCALELGAKANAIIKNANILPIWYPMIGAEYKF